MILKFYCINNCGREICKNTYIKGKQHCAICAKNLRTDLPNYKDGRCSKSYFCKKCNKKISRDVGIYGTNLCRSCAQSERQKIPETCNNYIDGRTKKTYYCIEDCGRTISYTNWLRGGRRCQTCCQSGELGNNYKDGSSGVYPIEFSKKLKEQIRKRDNYTCQNCNITEEEHIELFGKKLHVHHIDYNKFNCDKTNLITTCSICNFKANYNRFYWQEVFTYKIYLMEV